MLTWLRETRWGDSVCWSSQALWRWLSIACTSFTSTSVQKPSPHTLSTCEHLHSSVKTGCSPVTEAIQHKLKWKYLKIGCRSFDRWGPTCYILSHGRLCGVQISAAAAGMFTFQQVICVKIKIVHKFQEVCLGFFLEPSLIDPSIHPASCGRHVHHPQRRSHLSFDHLLFLSGLQLWSEMSMEGRELDHYLHPSELLWNASVWWEEKQTRPAPHYICLRRVNHRRSTLAFPFNGSGTAHW